MCGRARCTLNPVDAAKAVDVSSENILDVEQYRPSENMAPGWNGLVVYAPNKDSESEKKENPKCLQSMKWGLIPSFTKAGAKPDHFVMFNARSESLQERPAFRRLLDTKRCIAIYSGYYEWNHVKNDAQPYYLYHKSSPMKMAGLYDTWMNEEGDIMYSYATLTCDAKEQTKWMHPRLPVILSDEEAAIWLSNKPFNDIKHMLSNYQGPKDLDWHPVTKKMGSLKFHDSSCSEKVDIHHAADIRDFFVSKTKNTKSEVKKDTNHTEKDNIPSSLLMNAAKFENEDDKIVAKDERSSSRKAIDKAKSLVASLEKSPGKRKSIPKMATPSPKKRRMSQSPNQPTLHTFFKSK